MKCVFFLTMWLFYLILTYRVINLKYLLKRNKRIINTESTTQKVMENKLKSCHHYFQFSSLWCVEGSKGAENKSKWEILLLRCEGSPLRE